MTEKFLHYIWKLKLFKHNSLFTTAGEKITVVSGGTHNTDSGPDFLNAKIKIGNTLWAGNVELHIKASEWKQHKHHLNPAFANVILHVVLEPDQKIIKEDGSEIPMLALKGLFNAEIFTTYQQLLQSTGWIPCAHQIKKVNSITISQWMYRLLVERLEEKSTPVINSLKQNKNNWEESFYQFLAQAFGSRINTDPFLLLAQTTPLKVLARHKKNLMQLEALLFGAAGFLDEQFTEEYPNQLKKEFGFLKKKYDLKPLKKHVWKFLRLHPANFPTIRIAQMSQLIFNSTHLFSKIIETESLEKRISYFKVSTSPYWKTHYRFDKISVAKEKSLGKATIQLILINMLAPFPFVYGKMKDEETYIQQALGLLEKIPAEQNHIIQQWNSSGIKAQSAFESQALLQLKNKYCKNFRCLDCAIGHQLLKASAKQ